MLLNLQHASLRATQRSGSGVALAEDAEGFLRRAQPRSALATASVAWSFASSHRDRVAARIATRAAIAQVDALVLLDRLPEALVAARETLSYAAENTSRSMEHLIAFAHMQEVREVSHEYRKAAEGFSWLERELPPESGWNADLKMFCANHLVSLGIKNADRGLVDEGCRRGTSIRHLVRQPDEEAAFLQWVGLSYLRQADPDRAQAIIDESFEMRARTRRRDITKQFLIADLQFAHGQTLDALVTLDAAIAEARQADLVRHARAGEALRRLRFG